jgi:8-oxo-dGTP diphosphatase
MPPENWDGPDHTRPLLHKGLEQAKSVANGIKAFGPLKVVSSPATRCLATIEPLLVTTGLEAKTSTTISQDSYTSDGKKVFKSVRKRIDQRTATVFCSHGPVLPQLVTAAAEIGHGLTSKALYSAANLSVGSFSVIHFSKETEKPQIVAVETHQPAPLS